MNKKDKVTKKKVKSDNFEPDAEKVHKKKTKSKSKAGKVAPSRMSKSQNI